MRIEVDQMATAIPVTWLLVQLNTVLPVTQSVTEVTHDSREVGRKNRASRAR